MVHCFHHFSSNRISQQLEKALTTSASLTASSNTTIDTPDGVLQEQILQWMEQQRVVESLVKVYEDPTSSTLLKNEELWQNHDRSCSTEVLEDTPWCEVLRSSFLNYDDAEIDSGNKNASASDRKYLFGGVDIGWPNPSTSNHPEVDLQAVAVYVVVDARTMEVVYRDHKWISMQEIPPYVSTFLAFREIDPLQSLVQHQRGTNPDLTPAAIFVDGNGIFHPRHAGIACFLGVRTNIPTIGIGKTLLYIGNEDSESQDDCQWTRRKLDSRIDKVLHHVHRYILFKGETDADDCDPALAEHLRKYKGLIHMKEGSPNHLYTKHTAIDESRPRTRQELLQALFPYCNGISIPLEAPHSKTHNHRFKILGAALLGHGGDNNSSGSKRPIIVSVGHLLSLGDAISLTTSLSRFRIPEPIRQADLYGRELLRERKML